MGQVENSKHGSTIDELVVRRHDMFQSFISSLDYLLFINSDHLFSSRAEPMKFLLRLNPSLNAVGNVQKNTALHWAVASGNTGAVDLLLEAGASLDIKNVKVGFPLWYFIPCSRNV